MLAAADYAWQGECFSEFQIHICRSFALVLTYFCKQICLQPNKTMREKLLFMQQYICGLRHRPT
jgi:hypothetical protein